MKQAVYEALKAALSSAPYVANDGQTLLRAQIAADARACKPELIERLLGDDKVRETFFVEAGGALIFKADEFVRLFLGHEFLPSSYTSYANRIGLTVGGKYLKTIDDVVLDFPFKDCVLAGGQSREEDARQELLYHEVLARDEITCLLEEKVLTNPVRISKDGELPCEAFNENDNLLIRGNNLLALHSLKDRCKGSVKLIYIDPPYNTGTDSFKYNDNFNRSTWLTFIKNRLEVAKRFLKDDGFIVIHCDYIEDSYAKVLMDEVFGTECYVNNIAVRDSHPSGLKLSAKSQTIIKTKSTILVYRKLPNKCRINPIYQRRYEWDTHFNIFVDVDKLELLRESLKNKLVDLGVIIDSFSLDKDALSNTNFRAFVFQNKNKVFQSTKEIPEEGRLLSMANLDKVVEYKSGEYALNGRRLSPFSKSVCDVGFDGYVDENFGKLLCDFWDDIDFNNSQNEGGVSFPSGKKPELLLARIITMFTSNDDLVLDFFFGSGTTAAVAHKMGRRWIGIEQLEYGDNSAEVRLKKVIFGDRTGVSRALDWQGGGEFVTVELAKWNGKLIDEILAINDQAGVQSMLEKLQSMPWRAFINYTASPEYVFDAVKTDGQGRHFADLLLPEQKQLLIALLDKNYLYVNLSDLDAPEMEFDETTRRFNRSFYG